MSNDEYKFRLHVDGKFFMIGDASSISMIFCMLSGRNIQKGGVTHADYLAYMSNEHKTSLDLGMELQMFRPSGERLKSSAIGAELVQ